jgi:hypothetical protein
MRLYDYYIDLIIFFKTIFFILSLIHIYFKIKDNRSNASDNTNTNTNTNNTNTNNTNTNNTNTNNTNTNNTNTNNTNTNNLKTQQRIEYLRSSCEFVVTVLISSLLIYLFNPFYPKLYLVDKETKIVLCLFGIILLLTSKWHIVFNTNKFFVLFQEFLR